MPRVSDMIWCIFRCHDLLAQINYLSVCASWCWQMVAVYVHKQDVESLFFGTCTQKRVIRVRFVALESGVTLGEAQPES